jgi:non-specific protein-tyrosine kinase
VNQTATQNAITYNDALLSQQLVKTYSRMVQQPVVLEQVIERLQLPMEAAALGRLVSVQPIRETQLFEVAVEGTDPAGIRDIANTIAAVFVEQQGQQRLASQASSGLWVAQPALEPIEPIGPKPVLNAVLAAVLGLMVVVGVVALLEYLDDTVKSPEDLAQAASLSTLGTVMRLDSRSGESVLIGPARRHSNSAEAYRLVRTNLEFASVDEPLTTLLVTSSSPGEGKSTTASNLAIVLAQAGKRVILVDADMRKPTLHRVFGVPNHQGLSNLLLCEVERLDNHLKSGGIANLRVIPAGPLPPNPAELLSSGRLPKLLERLKGLADVVVIDSPPVLAVSDAIILAGRVDGTMLVVDSNRTRPQAVRRSAAALANSGTRLLGAVLNKVSKRAGGYGYFYGEYGAGETAEAAEAEATASA